MRILLVADLIGGVRTFIFELVRELSRRDAEVHLALTGGGPPPPGAASCELRPLRQEWIEDPVRDVLAKAEWVEARRDACRPDVIHMSTLTPVLARDVPVVLTAHSCRLARWQMVRGAGAPAQLDPYRGLAREAIRRADMVVAPTRAALDLLETIHGPLPQARVIPNGRDVGLPSPVTRGRESLVVSAGRLTDEARNAACLARAAERIDGHVALIGPGELDGAHEPLGVIDELEVLAWMSRAAVFASPARYEPFGLSALEAALCGCALVLGDIPSQREIWGNAASFVAPDDPDALAEAVNALLRDPLRRAAVARRAYDTARRYHPVAMTDRYLAAYRGLNRDAVAA